MFLLNTLFESENIVQVLFRNPHTGHNMCPSVAVPVAVLCCPNTGTYCLCSVVPRPAPVRLHESRVTFLRVTEKSCGPGNEATACAE